MPHAAGAAHIRFHLGAMALQNIFGGILSGIFVVIFHAILALTVVALRAPSALIFTRRRGVVTVVIVIAVILVLFLLGQMPEVCDTTGLCVGTEVDIQNLSPYLVQDSSSLLRGFFGLIAIFATTTLVQTVTRPRRMLRLSVHGRQMPKRTLLALIGNHGMAIPLLYMSCALLCLVHRIVFHQELAGHPAIATVASSAHGSFVLA